MTTNQGNPSQPRTIKASEFKAKCLKLMDEVADSGEEIVITKNGRPVARLTAYKAKSEKWFGADEGTVKILEDIISPLDVEWEAMTNPDRVLDPNRVVGP
ncbi:MAG: type II toxin-antitoxin system prevent-host-death family antitoxin [Chloroflexota bacterium]|nr:type II toxin-antitoxin system prevent-host-death family antitoxin [Chloroflexota bacterium]